MTADLRRVLLAVAAMVAIIVGSIPAASPVIHQESFTKQTSPFSHFQLNSPTPPLARYATAPMLPAASPPQTTAHIYYRYLDPVDNQGQVGSCQCYSFRHQYDYLSNWRSRRVAKPEQFSCKWWYSEVTKGKNLGTAPTQYTATLAVEGGILHSQYDWRGIPYSPATYPQPPWTYRDALPHRWSAYYTFYGGGIGAGYGAVAEIERGIALHHVGANVDIPIYSGYNGMYGNAEVDLPRLNSANPSQNDVYYGGHSMFVVAYNRNLTLTMADGERVTGWFLAQNSWGSFFGVSRSDWTHHPGPHNGYVLLSYRFVAAYAWAIGRLHIGHGYPKSAPLAEAAQPPVWKQPGPSISHPKPAPRPLARGTAQAGDWVYHIYARDLANYDLAPIINAAAHYYGLLAPGLAATIGTECVFQTHSTECDRLGGGADYSFGACQVTIGTASGYGLGNGIFDGYYGPNTTRVRTYENDPVRCIWLAARVLHDYASYLLHRSYDPCYVNFPSLYVAWNAGPGNPCSFIFNPSGEAGSNYYGNGSTTGFLAWWRYALSVSVNRDLYAKPKPRRVFPLTLWCEYARSHHLRCPAYTVHGRLSRHASVWWKKPSICRGTLGRQSWHPSGRRGRNGYMTYLHERCHIIFWPYHPTWRAKVIDP